MEEEYDVVVSNKMMFVVSNNIDLIIIKYNRKMSLGKKSKIEGEGLRAAFKDSLTKLINISTREQVSFNLRLGK